jgi:exodeoxyribonuclease V beta subunit
MSVVRQPMDILAFRFEGLQVIEASAGTGKTWTLALLYLRLLLGAGPGGRPLNPPDILVMTFTEAATQELLDRIRQRINEAVAVFRDLAPPPGKAHDAMLLALRATRPNEGWLDDARRLEAAGHWMDEAAIYTIHGWCSRMLRQHAFDSVSLFQQERVEDPQGLLEDVVRDYWRRWFYDADAVAVAAAPKLPATPDTLLKDLKPLLARLDRAPDADLVVEPESPRDWLGRVRAWSDRYEAAQRAAREVWRHGLAEIDTVLGKAVGKDLNANSYKPAKFDSDLQTMRDWSEGATLARDRLERYAQEFLRGKTKKNCTVPQHPAFVALQRVMDCGEAPGIEPLRVHAALALRTELAARKARLAQFDFNDLLQRLYGALHDPQRGSALAARLREVYPVALVDEFQDTDPWQYGALSRIYRDTHATPAALVMIGDPKQAIYRFRGANLKTYLDAQQDADGIHTLTGNYRSTQGLVAAVNHVFGGASHLLGDVGYEPVEARRAVDPLRDPQGKVLPAITVWQTREPGGQNAPGARAEMAAGFATQIVQLLNTRVVQPAEVAVLVRTGKHAQLIRKELSDRGVRSVYLSDRDSVYATDEAMDLWYILRAVAQPRSAAALRAALATRCFDHGFADLDRLLADETRFEQEAERFARWQLTWQRQGLLAMVYAVLHAEQIPARLLAGEDQGERRLTNLLHLGDLLQQASLQLQGEAAVVRYLADQIRDRPEDEGAAQLRLETDADLVKVITMHKSKGLQYPVVFVPFACEFRAAKQGDVDADDHQRLDEDVRLLYVAFTRAERALFVGVAPRKDDFPGKKVQPWPKSALSQLLGRQEEGDLTARLAEWAQCAHIAVVALPPADTAGFVAVTTAVERHRAAEPSRRYATGWRSSSFTALTRGLSHGFGGAAPTPGSETDDRFGDAQADAASEGAAGTAVPLPVTAAATAVGQFQDLGGGARFGDLLHGLLEWQLAAGWPVASDGPVDPADEAAWSSLVTRRAGLLGLPTEDHARLKDWVRALARCPLGASPVSGAEPLPALAALTGAWPEMGFVVPTRQVSVTAVDRLLRQYIQPGVHRESLSADDLEGQLTGFLDLVFESGGRYYVLDYKSNRLPDYAPTRLAEAVLGARYELQYALYLLALHRLLRSRVPDYDYNCHVGGAIYLFARGIDTPSNGIYRDCPPRALIEALDDLFRGQAAA